MNAQLKPIATADIDAHVGARIRARREVLGITQAQLGVAVGVKFQQVQKYESGKNRVSASRLFLIAEVLQCDLLYFWWGLPSIHALGDHDEPMSERETQMLAAFRKCSVEFGDDLIAMTRHVAQGGGV